jgi:acyl carrier protein
MSTNLHQSLRPYLQQLLTQNMDTQEFSDTDSLFLSGRIDSFSLMQLVMHLEENYQIDFSSVHFEAPLLDTVADIAAFIQEHSRATTL